MFSKSIQKKIDEKIISRGRYAIWCLINSYDSIWAFVDFFFRVIMWFTVEYLRDAKIWLKSNQSQSITLLVGITKTYAIIYQYLEMMNHLVIFRVKHFLHDNIIMFRRFRYCMYVFFLITKSLSSLLMLWTLQKRLKRH